MFVDASAICAIILTEPDNEEIYVRLRRSRDAVTSSMALWESVVSISRHLNVAPSEARRLVVDLFEECSVEIAAVPPGVGDLAIDAFERFGKGRHPAGLNFGDCFAYACARHYGVPLLYKGDDFARTDVAAA